MKYCQPKSLKLLCCKFTVTTVRFPVECIRSIGLSGLSKDAENREFECSFFQTGNLSKPVKNARNLPQARKILFFKKSMDSLRLAFVENVPTWKRGPGGEGGIDNN